MIDDLNETNNTDAYNTSTPTREILESLIKNISEEPSSQLHHKQANKLAKLIGKDITIIVNGLKTILNNSSVNYLATDTVIDELHIAHEMAINLRE